MTIVVSQLVAAAIDEAGSDDFGDPRWREGLDVLVDSANGEARLSPPGESLLTGWIHHRLVNRLGVTAWVTAHPDVLAERIERPLVVLGMLRTGTTILSELLGADPANRPLMKWEGLNSVPPPRSETFAPDSTAPDPRIAAEVDRQEAIYSMVPGLRSVHWEPGDGPTECVALLTQDFRAQDFPGLFHLPGYRRWFEQCDMSSAYEYHRRSLQVLQSQCPGRWSLKAPGHMLAIDALLAVYPDARLVVTHRDPVKTVGSSASLSTTSRPETLTLPGAFTRDDMFRYFGTMWMESLGLMVDRLIEVRDRIGDDRFYDVEFDRFVVDPIAEVGRIYSHFGEELSGEAEQAMRVHLDANPQGRYGTHEYTLERFGLSGHQINERFLRYTERYLHG